MITDIEIKDGFHALLQGTALAQEVTGKIFKRTRPKNAQREDIVISILANDAGQRQEAVVNVNVYVRDIITNGQSEEDTRRLRLLSRLAAELFECGRLGGARFILSSQRVFAVPETKEHVINNRIRITQINE